MQLSFTFRSHARRAVLLLVILLHSQASAEDFTPPAPLTLSGLHNTFRVSERFYSGSQPEGDAAFAELARLGVKTIVSVDGARPDIATARKYGLRYIHLPIGYDGVPTERIPELVRAAEAAAGGIYIHCHHGKHRGPAAVAIMCEATAGWSPERAEEWLRQAGTADDYPGLYRAARDFQRVTKEQLSRVGELPEVATTPDIVDAMVAIDERFEALKAAQKAGWKTPPDQPELAPAHEATLLWEHLRELARTEDTARRADDYRARLTESETATEALRTGLRRTPLDIPALDKAMKQTAESCVACHKPFRNGKK